MLNQNQFGGNAGRSGIKNSKIQKNKTFFFLSYQGTRQINGYSSSFSLDLPPIPATRTAAVIGAALATSKPKNGTATIAMNGSNINPVALAILNLKNPDGTYVIPSPQIVGSGVNYTASVPSTFSEDQGIASIDHQFGDNNHLSLKVMIGADPTYKALGSANVPGFGSTQDFKEELYTLSDTHIFSGSLVNDARFGVSRTIGTVLPQDKIPLSSIGMNRFNSSEYNDIPLITVTGGIPEMGYRQRGAGQHPTAIKPVHVAGKDGRQHPKSAGAPGVIDDNLLQRACCWRLTDIREHGWLLGLAAGPVACWALTAALLPATSRSRTWPAAFPTAPTGLPTPDFRAGRSCPRLMPNLGLRWEYLGWPVDAFGRRGNFDYQLYQAAPAGGTSSVGFVQSNTTKTRLPASRKSIRRSSTTCSTRISRRDSASPISSPTNW